MLWKHVKLPWVSVLVDCQRLASFDNSIFYQIVTSIAHLNFLHILAVSRICEMFADVEDLDFLQNGAPLHYRYVLRAYLHDNLPKRWIERRGEAIRFFSGDICKTMFIEDK